MNILKFAVQVHTTESKSNDDEGPEHDENAPDVNEDDLFQHVKKVDKFHDALAKDAATEEQAKEQLSVLDKEEREEEKEAEKNEDVAMKEDEEIDDNQHVDQLEAEKMGQSKKKGNRRGDPTAMEEDEVESKMEGRHSFRT